MPKSGFPLSVDTMILFELARGPGHGPDLLRRTRRRMDGVVRLHYGTYYPALERLAARGLIEPSVVPTMRRPVRPLKRYVLSQAGAKEARRLSGILHRLILPYEHTA